MKDFNVAAMGMITLLPLLAAGWVTDAHAPSGQSPTGEVQRILWSLGELPACGEHNCESCRNDRHEVIEWQFGNDGGPVHNCHFTEDGCADHSCNILVKDAAAQLPSRLEEISAEQLRTLVAENERLTINRDRRAVQLLSCVGRVVMSMKMTSIQQAGLLAAD